MARQAGITHVDCGKRWFAGWLKRAVEYKPEFGESKRSKMDVMRAQKQSPAVITKFFEMLQDIYAYHKNLGHFTLDDGFMYFKRRNGSDMVALRASILEESQKHWLKSAREIAEVRTSRAKNAYKGIPNTKTGACCTAKHFREALKEYAEGKSKAETDLAAKRKQRTAEKKDKEVQKQVSEELKKVEKEKPTKKKTPGAPTKKKRRRRAESEDEFSDDGIEVTPPSDDEMEEAPPLQSAIMVEVPTGEAKRVDVFYCTVDAYEQDGAAMLTTQAGETMNIFLEDYHWEYGRVQEIIL